MSSKYLSGTMRYPSDFSQSFVNIDTLCTVYSKTQELMGKTPTFKENGSKKGEEQPEQKKQTVVKTDAGCEGCHKECANKKIDLSLHGLFGNTSEELSDEEEIYICEFCTSLGYGNRYKPDVCDNCNTCESCREYMDEECSGCSYSRWRDGKYYRDKLDDTDLFSEQDLEVFESIKLDTKGGERMERGHFTLDDI